jgi:proton-coupled amino acid transporter
MEKFAFFHVFADATIAIGLAVIFVYAGMEWNENGFAGSHEPINELTFLSFIGLAAYTFEGIGIIIPVMETCSRPDLYKYIMAGVIILVTIVYLVFANVIYFVYGKEQISQSPLITDILPKKDIAIIFVKIIWIVNLVVTYPLVLHPANMVIESYAYRKLEKGMTRKWLKNMSRMALVLFTAVLAIALIDTLDKLESINGAFACIPLAFLLPSLFHYKLVAETVSEKIIDLTIAGFSFCLMITCTVITFIYWNE